VCAVLVNVVYFLQPHPAFITNVMAPLPVIVICGEAGSGKSTLSNALVDSHGFILVDGDLVHHSPPWNNMAIMHDLCAQFIQEESFMQSTIDTIVSEIEKSLLALVDTPSAVTGVVMPFVMYTQKSRRYFAHRLCGMTELVSQVKFVWLALDSLIHRDRNEERVEKWAAVGITMRPQDVVNLTKSLCASESIDDCLVLDNSTKGQIEANVAAVLQLLREEGS
jgi:ABC-type dipeptide/oligopeptide/nickel transport system ATPase component